MSLSADRGHICLMSATEHGCLGLKSSPASSVPLGELLNISESRGFFHLSNEDVNSCSGCEGKYMQSTEHSSCCIASAFVFTFLFFIEV